jgi:spore maturation protein SpmA
MIEDERGGDDMLMDMYAPVIAKRFVSWATDYNINGAIVANMAVRILPLLTTNDR